MMGGVKHKYTIYKTARARIACAKFTAGEYVSIAHDYIDDKGQYWYLITSTERGPLEFPVAYPMKHLTDFVL
jgi:hypothetical protein